MARSNEPAVWSLFSAGGMLTAFVLPAHIMIFGFVHATGIYPLSHAKLHGIVTHPLGKMYLIALITLALFHAAHRMASVLQDLGLKPYSTPIKVVGYGGAVVGGILSVVLVISL